MNWLYYLAEANLYLGVFYLAYCLFLHKETYYLLNRVYLLFSCIISFILPLLQLGILKPVTAVTPIIIDPPVVVIHYKVPPVEVLPVHHYFTVQNGLLGVYLLGVVVLTVFLSIKLYRLFKLTHEKSAIIHDRYKLIRIGESNTAFSFFNCLFIGTKASDTETIIRHELVHIRQKHSVDIILLELIKIINWFNPLVYLLQNSLKTVHEYIADEQTALLENAPLTYSAFLVNNAYGISGPSITQSFFNYNLLKKRIIMLHQKRSGSLARLKYLVTVPVCAGLLCSSTLAFSKTYRILDLFPQRTDTIRKIAPPPPPRPPAGGSHAKVDIPAPRVDFATPKHPAQITGKGYHYAESGYLINGKTNYRVIIVEKNGSQKSYYKNSASPAELKLLKDKYGYQFPTMEIYAKLPPPPPLAPGPVADGQPVSPIPPKAVKAGKINPAPPLVKPDGAPLSTPKIDIKPVKPAKPAVPADARSLPPPMAPYMPLPNPFVGLDKYISKYMRYPKAAMDKKLTGSVIEQFDLSADHKITNVTLLKGIGSGCDKEATRVLNAFNETVDAKPGTYKVAITITMDGMEAPQPASETLSKDPSFIGEVVIGVYYTKL